MLIKLENLTESYIVINSINQKLPPKQTAIFDVVANGDTIADKDILGLEKLGYVKITNSNTIVARRRHPSKPRRTCTQLRLKFVQIFQVASIIKWDLQLPL